MARLRRSCGGSNTPIIEWPDCADHALARLRRSSGGSITPIPEWLEYAGQ
jgi:hypothetical protein